MKPSLSFLFGSFIITAALSLISIPASAQTVGADGSFNYTIPIELPEGTAGMAPELALVYNSNSDNGMLGVGWSLAGLPCITRDSTYTIQYDGGDSFVGPGGRLVLIDSADGIYHYENESFCKIQEFDSQGDGPSYFIETKPDGTKYYYGYTDDDYESTYSKILALSKTYNSESCVRVWALSKVEDIYGNYYTITYTQNNGAYYPAEITYTENSNPLYSIDNKRIIEFGYDEELSANRTDYYSNQAFGSQVEYHSLLTSITITADGTEHTYTLGYNVGSTAVKSRLTSVEDSWEAAGATEMHYINEEEENNAWEASSYSLPISLKSAKDTSGNTTQIGELADLNGDGLIDFVAYYLTLKTTTSSKTAAKEYIYINNGTSFNNMSSSYSFPVYFSSIKTATDYTYYYPYWVPNFLTLSDINGDGLTDVTNNTTIYYNKASTLWPSTTATSCPFPSIKGTLTVDYDYTRTYSQIGSITDLDGDGLADCAVAYNSIKKTYLSKNSYSANSNYKLPAVFAKSSSYTLYNGTYTYWQNTYNSKMRLMDINGDGYTDCIVDQLVYLNTGSGISTSANSTWKLPISLYSGNYQIGDLADVNGDGLLDCVISYKNSSANIVHSTYLNTGHGFISDSNFILPNTVFFVNLRTYETNSIRLIDINGDGLTDCISGQTVYLRKGTTKKHLLTKVTSPLGGSTSVAYKVSTKFTDNISIDGTGDKAIDPSTTAYPTVVNNSPRYLVESVTADNGLTATTAADAEPASFKTLYSYDHGMRYSGYPYERKDLYFECVTSQTNGGPYTKTYYNQTYDLAGKIAKIEDYDSGGLLMKTREYAYEAVYPYTDINVTWVKLTSETETTYEGGADNIVFANTKAYTYDSYGNQTLITETPSDTGLSVINTAITYDYSTIADDNVLSLPLEIRIYRNTASGNPYKWQKFTYNAHKKLETKMDLLTSTNYITTSFTYDNYGNIETVISPSPAGGTSTTTIVYDSTYHTFPESVTDPVGTIYTEFDPSSGNKLSVTDYNGNKTEYIYDSYKRLIEIDEPGLGWTKKIEYVNWTDPATRYVETRSRKDADGNSTFERVYSDALGRKYKTVSSSDADYDRVQKFGYDTLGRLSWESNAYLALKDETTACDSVYYTTYSYDNAGRIIEKKYGAADTLSAPV